MVFQSFEDGIEVNGRTIYSIVDGFKMIKSLPTRILLENGIGAKDQEGRFFIKANDWYARNGY